jgi:hypothetical protein
VPFAAAVENHSAIKVESFPAFQTLLFFSQLFDGPARDFASPAEE